MKNVERKIDVKVKEGEIDKRGSRDKSRRKIDKYTTIQTKE